MHTRLLDVLHDGADHHVLAVADAIDIDLDRVVEKAVEQHRRFVADPYRLAHVALQVLVAVHDLHRPAAQHVARAHHQRVADLLGQHQGRLFGAGGAVGRLLQAQRVQQLLETLAVLGDVDRVG